MLVLLLGGVAPAAAQVYRWVDAQGKVQMGDRPPAGVDARLLADRSGTHRPQDPAADRERAQQQRDRWTAEIYKKPVPAAPIPAASKARYPAPPPDSASACAKARYWLQAARDGQAGYCRARGCVPLDHNDQALLEREAQQACQQR